MVKKRDGVEADRALEHLGENLSLVLVKWLVDTKPTALWQSCATCRYMQRKGPAHCVKYNMTPPVTVIVGETRCEGYHDAEEIPF